jgi:hypothetical protein
MHLLINRGLFNDDFNSTGYVELDDELNSERQIESDVKGSGRGLS